MVKRGKVKHLESWGGNILGQFGAEMERTKKKLVSACNLQKLAILRGGSSQRINVSSRPSKWASQVALVVKNPPANAGDIRDAGSVPGSGRSLGGGNGNPLLYSCLENPMGRGAWWASVHGVAKSQIQLK